MKVNNIRYVAGKIKNVSKHYISGQLNDKNGTKEIAQLVYHLEIEDLDGNKHVLVTPYQKILEQKSYAHFFYNEDNIITDVLKCHEKNTKYLISKNSKTISILVVAFVFFLCFFLYPSFSNLMVTYEKGIHSLLVSILTTIPVVINIILILLSGLVLILEITDYLSSLFIYKKLLKYRKFSAQVNNNNNLITKRISA